MESALGLGWNPENLPCVWIFAEVMKDQFAVDTVALGEPEQGKPKQANLSIAIDTPKDGPDGFQGRHATACQGATL